MTVRKGGTSGLVVDVELNEGGQNVKSYFNHNNLTMNKENFVKHICERLGIWTGHYSFFSHYTDSEGYTCLVFDHKFGIKWSRILANLHATALDRWFGLKTVWSVTPKTAFLKRLTEILIS